MKSSNSLEEYVFQLKEENEKLKSEMQRVQMRNALLLETNESLRNAGNNSLESGRNQRMRNDNDDIVIQLKGVIERLKKDIEVVENEKNELLEEIDKAAEREILLEEKVDKGFNENIETLKELEDFKSSLRALFPSSETPSDLYGFLDNIERREEDVSKRDRELERREKIFHEKWEQLDKKEQWLEEWETRLRGKDLSSNSVPRNINQTSNVFGADSVSLQGTLRSQHEELKKETWSKKNSESRFEAAKERLIRQKNDLNLGESVISKQGGQGTDRSSSRSQERKRNTMSQVYSDHSKQPVINQVIDEFHYKIDEPEDYEDETDTNKITFHPNSMNQKLFEDVIQPDSLSQRKIQEENLKCNPFENINDHYPRQSNILESNNSIWRNQELKEFKPTVLDSKLKLDVFNDHDFEEPEAKGHLHSDNNDHLDVFHVPEAAPARDNHNDSATKKAIAFDLFDESIDEKKRAILIQKLQRNRSTNKETKNGSLIPKTPPKAEEPEKESRTKQQKESEKPKVQNRRKDNSVTQNDSPIAIDPSSRNAIKKTNDRNTGYFQITKRYQQE